MRIALWLLGLFALASALALFVGNNEGVVTLFWPPHRIDVSVNLVLVILVVWVVLVWLCARALGALLALPREARRWRALQRERAMSQQLFDAISNLLAGRYLRARKQALSALAHGQALEGEAGAGPTGHVIPLAHVVLAESAHALQDRGLRDRHVSLAVRACGAVRPGNLMAEAVHLQVVRWAIEDRDAHRALVALDELPPPVGRRLMALRWRLRASRWAGRVEEALGAGRLLVNHKAFPAGVSASVIRSLVNDLLTSTQDEAQLERAWQAIDSSERSMPELASRAAQRMLELGGEPQRALAWLLPAWESLQARGGLDNQHAQRRLMVDAVLAALAALQSRHTGASDGTLSLGSADAQTSWLARVELAHRQNPADVSLRYAAGMACHLAGLWGKSQQLLQAVATAPGVSAAWQRRTWRALADIAERRGDDAAALAAWKRAAQLDAD